MAATVATANTSARLRSWYFAEGNSRRDFQTFFTLLNLSDQPASVTASYDRDDGIRLVQWLGIPPQGRISLNANDIVGPRSFGASFHADQDVIVERATTWGPGQNGDTMVGFAPRDLRAWYFAEGTTLGGLTTYFVTQNLSDAPADVTATFAREDGTPVRRSIVLGPRARDALRVNDLLPDSAFSARFQANQDVVVERTIVSEGEHDARGTGRSGSSRRGAPGGNGLAEGERSRISGLALGILGGLGYPADDGETGSRTWYFAEGSTRQPYETQFILFNPGGQPVPVRLRLAPQSGDPATRTLVIPPLGRVAVDARELLQAADFTTSIRSDLPIIAERVYSSTGDGLYGALGYTPGRPRGQTRSWYFADGNTTGGNETFFTIANLTDQPAQVDLAYFGAGATLMHQSVALVPNGRASMRANDAVDGQTFSARVSADRDIVVERTVYFRGGSGYSTAGAAP
ncbi:MAG: hypothetical protein IT305_26875 [Chloroflexi bacterium]|nr:hypothetical protein [Chloroflexota bacterium]